MLILNVVALALAILMTWKVHKLSWHPDLPVLNQAAGRLTISYGWWLKLIPRAVIIFDFDFLKAWNTASGLQSLTDYFMAIGLSVHELKLRKRPWWRFWRHDLVFQYDNGDKYAVIIPWISDEQTNKLAHRIKAHLESTPIPPDVMARYTALTGLTKMSATFVVINNTTDIWGALQLTDAECLAAKERGLRSQIITIEG